MHNLTLNEGFLLSHGQCLNAVAAMHGYADWNVVSDLSRTAPEELAGGNLHNLSIDGQSSRLSRHLNGRYGLRIADGHEAVAAIRWGGFVQSLNDLLGDALAASRWLNTPRPEFSGRSAADLVESDTGCEQIQRAMLQVS